MTPFEWVAVAVLAYLASSYLAYRLMRWSWLQEFDLTRGDQRIFKVMAVAGPLSLIPALLLAAEQVFGMWENEDEVVAEKKGNQ